MYQFENTRDDRKLVLKLGKSERTVTMEQVSNSPFTDVRPFFPIRLFEDPRTHVVRFASLLFKTGGVQTVEEGARSGEDRSAEEESTSEEEGGVGGDLVEEAYRRECFFSSFLSLNSSF